MVPRIAASLYWFALFCLVLFVNSVFCHSTALLCGQNNLELNALKTVEMIVDYIVYAAITAKDKGRLQRIIRSTEKVISCNMPEACRTLPTPEKTV